MAAGFPHFLHSSRNRPGARSGVRSRCIGSLGYRRAGYAGRTCRAVHKKMERDNPGVKLITDNAPAESTLSYAGF